MGWKEGALRAECRGLPDGSCSKFGAGTRVLLFYPFQFRPFPSDATVLRHGEPCTAFNVINTRLPLLPWLSSVCLSVWLLLRLLFPGVSPESTPASSEPSFLLCSPGRWGSCCSSLQTLSSVCAPRGKPSEVMEHLDSGFRSSFSNLARPGRICQMPHPTHTPKSEMQEPVILLECNHSQQEREPTISLGICALPLP